MMIVNKDSESQNNELFYIKQNHPALKTKHLEKIL